MTDKPDACHTPSAAAAVEDRAAPGTGPERRAVSALDREALLRAIIETSPAG